MEQLINNLAKRHVTVTVIMKPRLAARMGQEIRDFVTETRIEAIVETTKSTARFRSWPMFEFTVSGNSLEEVESAIEDKLSIVEPIIRANELSYNHETAVRKASDAESALTRHVKQKDNTSSPFSRLFVPNAA